MANSLLGTNLSTLLLRHFTTTSLHMSTWNSHVITAGSRFLILTPHINTNVLNVRNAEKQDGIVHAEDEKKAKSNTKLCNTTQHSQYINAGSTTLYKP